MTEKNITRRKALGIMGATTLSLFVTACSGRGNATTGSTGSQASSGQPSSSSQGNTVSASSSATDSSSSSAGSPSSSGGKILVAYYSAQGHTRRVAEAAAGQLGADIFELVPQDPYSNEDLNYNASNSRVSQEYQDSSKRDVPLVQTTPDNWADYDVVLLGYPIWWGGAAWPVNHFASDNDFDGKIVIPFCTSYSSGLGSSARALSQMAGTGTWQDGHRFSEGANDSEVEAWAKDLDL